MQELANQGSKPGGGGSAAADLTQQQPLLQLEAPAAPAAAANGAPEHGDEAVIEGFQSGSDDSEGDDSDVEVGITTAQPFVRSSLGARGVAQMCALGLACHYVPLPVQIAYGIDHQCQGL